MGVISKQMVTCIKGILMEKEKDWREKQLYFKTWKKKSLQNNLMQHSLTENSRTRIVYRQGSQVKKGVQGQGS